MPNTEDILKNLSPAQRELFLLRMNKASKEKNNKNKILKKSKEGVPAPLSFAQVRLWFLDQLEPGNSTYNMPAAVGIKGKLKVESLEKAVNEIIRRHHTLRTSFKSIDDNPMQIINPLEPITIPIVDVTNLAGKEQSEQVEKLIKQEVIVPFDLSQAPLIRVKVFKLNDEEHTIAMTVHHIVSDGLSMGVLVNELTTLYMSYSNNQPSPLPEIDIQYADFAIWQNEKFQGENLEKELKFWEENLDGCPTLIKLPTDLKRPPVQTFRGSTESIAFEQEFTREIKEFAQRSNLTTFMIMVTALNILLYKYSGQKDIVIGTPIAGRNNESTENLIGLFLNNLVLRTEVDETQTFDELLQKVREICLNAYSHQDMPFEKLVEELSPERNMSHSPLFQVMFVLQGETGRTESKKQSAGDLEVESMATETGTAKFDLTFQLLESSEHIGGVIEYSTDLYERPRIKRLIEHYKNIVRSAIKDPNQKIWELDILSKEEKKEITVSQNQTAIEYDLNATIDKLISKKSKEKQDEIALICGEKEITYLELEKRSNLLAGYLRKLGVNREHLVGVNIERSIDMVIGLLAVLKAGGGYVPLDPDYPLERLQYMTKDANLKFILRGEFTSKNKSFADSDVEYINIDEQSVIWKNLDESDLSEINTTSDNNGRNSGDTAYVIYTSGSTGKPKGVVLTHRNVVNFFTAMNEKLGDSEDETWLAVTSISFDISVLEIFWTLSKGTRVVIQPSHIAQEQSEHTLDFKNDRKGMEFGLFYFANNEVTNENDCYKILIEGAKYADNNGLTAVWTPERHFHSFGGLYPNPAITNAALATITQNISLRAGSVVLPLHDPVRVAEEWSVIDLLSNGRTGISFASGWHADDFVLMPENYSQRSNVMYEEIEKFKSLWRGEKLKLKNGQDKEIEIQTLPRPQQKEIPMWITTGGSPETFRLAGEKGAFLLTHFLVQNIEELEEKIKIYRKAWKEHSGKPGNGHVTLMIHTFVSENIDYVEEVVKEPFQNYLRGSLGLMKNLYRDVDKIGINTELTEDDIQVMLEHSFNRYFRTASLMGTPKDCLKVVDDLKGIGVDELACLIDFGIASDVVLENLKYLKEVKTLTNEITLRDDAEQIENVQAEEFEDFSIIGQMEKHQISHLQCTPSTLRLISADRDAAARLNSLEKLLLGGEAIPQAQAIQLKQNMSGQLYNMYGPTETTIWSTTTIIQNPEDGISIGKPIANTQTYILDDYQQPVPYGVIGELYIGGDGVARGYRNRPDLTAEKFIPNPFIENGIGSSEAIGARLYRTGDQAFIKPDGSLEFVGRIDNQVKIRGYRIELGEIETILEKHARVNRAVVIADSGEDLDETRLIAYLQLSDESVNDEPSVNELRNFVKNTLPEYMIPSIYMFIEKFPLTPNGKIDRQALPKPEGTDIRGNETEYVEPRTPTEEMVVDIWKEVLRGDKIGVNDNFFELGGHSLLATLLLSRIQKNFNVELPLRIVFESPTVAEQSEAIINAQVETIGGDSLEALSDEVLNLSDAELQALIEEEKLSATTN